jgi:hypothetical protein
MRVPNIDTADLPLLTWNQITAEAARTRGLIHARDSEAQTLCRAPNTARRGLGTSVFVPTGSPTTWRVGEYRISAAVVIEPRPGLSRTVSWRFRLDGAPSAESGTPAGQSRRGDRCAFGTPAASGCGWLI